jgi:hypothetical protein
MHEFVSLSIIGETMDIRSDSWYEDPYFESGDDYSYDRWSDGDREKVMVIRKIKWPRCGKKKHRKPNYVCGGWGYYCM